MASRKQHPAELRDRAVAMVFELRAASGSSRGTLANVGHKLGVNPETLRNWVEKAEIDSGHRSHMKRSCQAFALPEPGLC